MMTPGLLVYHISHQLHKRAFFRIEKIIFANNPQPCHHGRISQGTNAGMTKLISSFTADSLPLKPRFKVSARSETLLTDTITGRQEKGFAIFTLQRRGESGTFLTNTYR